MSHQVYAVVNELPCGDTVVLEVLWSGTPAIPLGSLPAGGEMRARFAVFLEFRDGKIVRQRNYDCFDPW
jgi:ketosteroid isomerase-like protein